MRIASCHEFSAPTPSGGPTFPAADNDCYRRRAGDKGALAARIEQWHSLLRNHWSEVRFGNLYVQEQPADYVMRVQVYLGRLNPDSVTVEFYADAPDRNAAPVLAWSLARPFPARSTAGSTRLPSRHTEALIPLEAKQLLWLR